MMAPKSNCDNRDLPAMPLTKREHFAAMVLPELMRAHHECGGCEVDDWAIELGKRAVEAADGLLEALDLMF